MAKLKRYRGKGGVGRVVLVVLLVVAIIGVFTLYTYNTNEQFSGAVDEIFSILNGEGPTNLPPDLPEEDDILPPEDLVEEQVVEEVPAATEGRVVSLSDMTVDEAIAVGAYAVMVDLKLAGGEVAYLSSVPSAAPATIEGAIDLAALVERCDANGLALWGRISAFDDELAPRNVSNSGTTVDSGVLFLDGNYELSLDPYKPAAVNYVTSLAREAVDMGVDMVVLSDMCYPSFGRLSLIDYPQSPTKTEQIEGILAAMSDLPITVQIPMEAYYNEDYNLAAGYGFAADSVAVVIDEEQLPQTVNGVLCESAEQFFEASGGDIAIGGGNISPFYVG